MVDPSGALDEMLRSFALAPENPSTQEEILRLARVTGRWEEAIRVEGHLFALAETLPEKLEIARNAAYLVEHEVKDLVRAFRAYLNAFRLAPDDDEIVGHLWRLAAGIGNYHTFAVAAAAARVAAAETTAADATAAETTAVEATAADVTAAEAAGDDEDIAVDVEDIETETTRETSATNGEARHADAADFADDEATPPPVRADAIDGMIAHADDSGVVARADDAVIDEAEADVIEELDAELLEDTSCAATASPLDPLPRRRRRRHPTTTSLSRPPGRSWPTRTTACPRRTSKRAASTCARSSTSGSAARRTSIARWGRWNAPSASTSRTPRSARSWNASAAQYDRWDRIVDDLPGRDRRVRADRHRRGAAPRRRAPARAPRAEGQGRGAIRRDPAAQVRRRGRPGARRGDVPRPAALGGSGQRAREAHQRADRSAAAGTGPPRAAAGAGGAVRGSPGAPLRGDRHAGTAAVRGRRGRAQPRRSRDARREPGDAGRARGAGAAVFARRAVGQGRR